MAEPVNSSFDEMTGDVKKEHPDTSAQEADPDSPVLADLPEEPSSAEMKAEEETEKPSKEPFVAEGSMPGPSSSASGSEEKVYDQGIWGQTKTTVDPETIEAFIRSTAEAERENDETFNKMADTKDKLGLEDTMAYKKFIFEGVQIERASPLEAFQKQRRGYNMSGIFHTGIRDTNVNLFKLQHMA